VHTVRSVSADAAPNVILGGIAVIVWTYYVVIPLYFTFVRV
jgi:hypothetical protein